MTDMKRSGKEVGSGIADIMKYRTSEFTREVLFLCYNSLEDERLWQEACQVYGMDAYIPVGIYDGELVINLSNLIGVIDKFLKK